MFGDKLLILFVMGCIVFFGLRAINRRYFTEEEQEIFPSAEEVEARNEEKKQLLKELKARYTHLQDEITITDDLIMMKNNVEVSEDEVAALDKALAEEKVTAEEPAEASDEKEEKK